MSAECSTQGTLFPDITGRDAVVRFDAGAATTDAWVLLVERIDRRIGLSRRFADCFRDHRAHARGPPAGVTGVFAVRIAARRCQPTSGPAGRRRERSGLGIPGVGYSWAGGRLDI